MKKLFGILALIVVGTSAFGQEKLTRLLRQPDIHGDAVAFDSAYLEIVVTKPT
jgi:hypothetical protein